MSTSDNRDSVGIDPAFLKSWRRYIANVSAKARRRKDIINILTIVEREGVSPPPSDATDHAWLIYVSKALMALARSYDLTSRCGPQRNRTWSEMRVCELVADFWHEKERGPERSDREICALFASAERYANRWGGTSPEGLRNRLKEGLACRFVAGIVLGNGPPEQQRDLRDTFISLFRLP